MEDRRESESSNSKVEIQSEGDTDKLYSDDDCESNGESEDKTESELESSEENDGHKEATTPKHSRPKKRRAGTATKGSEF